MKTTQRVVLVLFSLILLALATTSPAAIVFFDTFEDVGVNISTKGNDAFDATDVPWYSASDFGSALIASDSFAGGGSLKALELDSTDTFRRMGANFPTTTLGANVGDKIILSFDMRFVATPAANANGFRFGLHNSNGSFITTDNPQGTSQPNAQSNDFGYYVRFGTGGTTNNELLDEPAGAVAPTPGPADNPTGGTIAGTVFGTAVGTAGTINDTAKHSFILELTRGASNVAFSMSYDNVVKLTATDATPFTTFDMVYFSKGSIATDFRVDNVKLETVLVPEPAACGTLLLGLYGLLQTARARRRS